MLVIPLFTNIYILVCFITTSSTKMDQNDQIKPFYNVKNKTLNVDSNFTMNNIVQSSVMLD
jgi:hypothetical protein